MPSIDITTMSGETPRIVAHLLSDSSSTHALNCHFRHGVISANREDTVQSHAFSFVPDTIFHYRDDYWFACLGWGFMSISELNIHLDAV
ncbi:MAG: hypothetical protein WAU54_01610 [Chania sp.]